MRIRLERSGTVFEYERPPIRGAPVQGSVPAGRWSAVCGLGGRRGRAVRRVRRTDGGHFDVRGRDGRLHLAHKRIFAKGTRRGITPGAPLCCAQFHPRFCCTPCTSGA